MQNINTPMAMHRLVTQKNERTKKAISTPNNPKSNILLYSFYSPPHSFSWIFSPTHQTLSQKKRVPALIYNYNEAHKQNHKWASDDRNQRIHAKADKHTHAHTGKEKQRAKYPEGQNPLMCRSLSSKIQKTLISAAKSSSDTKQQKYLPFASFSLSSLSFEYLTQMSKLRVCVSIFLFLFLFTFSRMCLGQKESNKIRREFPPPLSLSLYIRNLHRSAHIAADVINSNERSINWKHPDQTIYYGRA